MQDNGNILAIMAHPDDIEFLCAGTLLRLKALGYQIHLATMTAGDGGSAELPPDAIANVRFHEGQQAAELIGATYHCAGLKDFFVRYEPESIKRVAEIIRQTQPFLIITHYPVDYMIDHEETSRIVRMAAFGAGAPNLKTDALPAAPLLHGIPYLYYSSPIEGKDTFGRAIDLPLYFDISGVIDTKEAMLKCHASQRDWLLQHHGMDEYLMSMRKWSAELGRRLGVEYAEGFQQHLGHSYPQDDWLSHRLA